VTKARQSAIGPGVRLPGWIAPAVLGLCSLPLSAAGQTPPPADMASAHAALAAAPKAEIAGGSLRATILLPDPQRGFYRGTRFDWSGVISSLTYRNQEYYGLWFAKVAPKVRDYVFHEGEIVAGPNTATLGPAEAFDPEDPPGFEAAEPGGAFLKIGVGLLRKPADGAPYSSYRTYEFIDGGAWTTNVGRDRVDFTHTLPTGDGGWGYVYRKTVRLGPGRAQMRIDHSLTNTGSRPLATTTFNHNFLTFGGEPTGPGLSVETPFVLTPAGEPRGEAAAITGNRIVYGRALADRETMFARLTGFGPAAKDNRIRVRNGAGAGFTVVGDRPLVGFTLWSIRPTVSPEPFISLSAQPGETVAWSHVYTYAAPE
jgi:hypothetical protein